MFKWKPWFAWKPVKIGNKYKWLSWVQRRKQWKTKQDVVHKSYLGYEYR